MHDEPASMASAREAETPRRSTVRERAPVGDDYGAAESAPVEPAPASAPALKISGGDDSDQPRRSGWWSRRFAGGDKG